MKKVSGIAKACIILSFIAPSWAHATAGCGEIISIAKVNKEPMDDIYRLNKQGIATGGIFTQILSAVPGVGVFAAAAADSLIGAVASDIKQTNASDKINQEQKTGQYDDVYDVTIKPDFGNPITITIRENEIDRFGLKEERRAIIYYPNTDPTVITGNNAQITRTRPSFSKKVVYGWYDAPDKPADGAAPDDHYNEVCYRGQKAQSIYIASGPWDPSTLPWAPMTDSEIRQATNDYSREVYRLELRKKYLTEQESQNPELAQVDLEIPKYKLLFAEGMAYSRKADDSADWRVKKFDDEIKQLQEQVSQLKKNDPKNVLADNAEQAKFHQSITFRLKEKAEKSTSTPVKEAVN